MNIAKSVMVEVTRDSLVECQHRASAVVVDPDGHLFLSIGQSRRLTHLRSLAKPFQALPLLESGAAERFGLEEPDIAIIASSHNGESFHVDRVRSILHKADLSEDILECGVHPPYFVPMLQQVLTEYGELLPVHNNCSGKHAGMLLLAKHLGFSLEDYVNCSHPVQKLILEKLEGILALEYKQFSIAVDGCGVPTVAAPLESIARAYAMLAVAAESTPLGVVRKAMTRHPRLIAGTGRMETALVRRLPLLAKSGADGLMAVAIPSREWGLVVKVHSGSPIIADIVALGILKELSCIGEEDLAALEQYYSPPVLNCRGERVGGYRMICPDIGEVADGAPC